MESLSGSTESKCNPFYLDKRMAICNPCAEKLKSGCPYKTNGVYAFISKKDRGVKSIDLCSKSRLDNLVWEE